MGHHKHGVRQWHADADVAQEQTCQAAMQECENKTDGKQHGYIEMNAALPKRQNPVINFQSSGYGNDQGCGGKEESEIRIHATDIHVVCPDKETENANGDNGPDHHAITKNVLSGVNTEQVRDNAKCRQGNDVDLRVAKKPEQMLEQQRTATGITGLLTHRHQCRHKEAGAQQQVKQHHHRADKQSRKGKQGQNGCNKNAPYGQWHAHQSHATGTSLQNSDNVIQAAHGKTNDEKNERYQHENNAPGCPRGAWQNRLRRVKGPARPGGSTRHKKTDHQKNDGEKVYPKTQHIEVRKNHVSSTHHQRNQVVAKTT